MSEYKWVPKSSSTSYGTVKYDYYYVGPDGKVLGSVTESSSWVASIEGSDWTAKYMELDKAKKAVVDKLQAFQTNDRNGIILIGSIFVLGAYYNWTQLSFLFHKLFNF